MNKTNYLNNNEQSFQKGFFVLIISITIIFINRIFSGIFSPQMSSVFIVFGGVMINYTALFYFIIGMSFYNLRKAFIDERIICAFNVLTVFVWCYSLFLLFFPTASVKYGIVHLPFFEICLIIAISFLSTFIKSSKTFTFHFRFSSSILLYFILPFSLISIPQIYSRIMIITYYGLRLYFVLLILLFVIYIYVFIVSLVKRRMEIFVNIFKKSFFLILAIYLYLLNSPVYHAQIQRIAYIIFYPVLFPAIYTLFKNKQMVFNNIKDFQNNELNSYVK